MDTAIQAQAWGVPAETGVLRDVILASPEHFHWLPTSSVSKATLASGAEFDRDLALRQHAEMVAAYADAGVTVHYLEADPHLPYQVFARDSSVMTPYGAIVTQMAQWWRRGEYAPVIRFYEERQVPIFGMVTAGSLEGGDVILLQPGVAMIGCSEERTQQHAADQVAGWLREEGWEVLVEPIAEHYVHLDLMVCMLRPGLAAVCPDTTSDRVLDYLRAHQIETVPVSYRDTMTLGCNVVSLGQDRVLSTADSAELNGRLRALGLTVYDPDISMFTLGGGGVHCLMQALHRVQE
jgi:N-dimethylarginine dimethylaminohydrolase